MDVLTWNQKDLVGKEKGGQASEASGKVFFPLRLKVLWVISVLPQSSSTWLCSVWHLSVARLLEFLNMHCIQTLQRFPLKFNKGGHRGETSYISSSVTPQEV